MIKICYVIGQLDKGGAERQLYELVKGIDKNTYSPVVISLEKGGSWSKEIKDLNIDVIEITRNKSFEIKRLFELIQLFRTIQPDIVHSFLFSANSYARITSIIVRTPIIIASERSFPLIGKDKSIFQILVDKLLLPFSDAIICNSSVAAEMLKAKFRYNKNKVFIVPNGLDVDGFLSRIKSGKKKMKNFIIGTVGSLSIVKNHHLFLETASILLKQLDKNKTKFWIVGDGPLRKNLEAHARELKIEDNITFFGERSDIPEILQEMNVFVLTSFYEGMSNAIMEAMLAGLPVVAIDVGGNKELIQNNITGYLCPSHIAADLAEKILYLI